MHVLAEYNKVFFIPLIVAFMGLCRLSEASMGVWMGKLAAFAGVSILAGPFLKELADHIGFPFSFFFHFSCLLWFSFCSPLSTGH